MSKPGTLEYDYSPLRSSCPRCGAALEEACEPIRPHGHATILGYHHERGTSPGHLEREGYMHYALADKDYPDGQRMNLWRKPRQMPVERAGWIPVSPAHDSVVDRQALVQATVPILFSNGAELGDRTEAVAGEIADAVLALMGE